MNCLYKFLLIIIVTSSILFIPQKKSQPIHASEASYHTEYGIASFDHSQITDQLLANIEKNLPDFFIIHNVNDDNTELPDPLSQTYLKVPCLENMQNSIQNEIYYKKCFNVEKSKTIWLSGTPDIHSKVKGSANFETCTYALFTSQYNGESIAIFASGIDNNSEIANMQTMYLFSKFQCYRDYYPTVLSIRCNDEQNVKMFDDEGLSQKLSNKSNIHFFASSTVKTLSHDNLLLKISTDKPPKKLKTSGKYIAITFDDGPTRLKGRTDKILEAIEKYNVKATFFVLGSRISDDNPKEQEMIKKERSLGCEIGNHTYNHDSYAKLKDIISIKRQIYETDVLINKICSGNYATLLRPPGGIVNNKPDLDRPIINWSVDTVDWSSKQTVNGLIDTIKREAGNGKIVLMHDIHTRSAKAIDEIIKYLLENDYNIVTVSELMEFCDVEMWAGYIYTDANHEKRTTFCN